MKIAALIPARYDASRFDGKLMKLLHGKPVIVRTYQAAKETQLFDEVYVVTNSEIIYNAVVDAGGQAILNRTEHSCGSDRIAEALQQLPDVDIVVNVQGDEPFTNRETLEKLIAPFRGEHAANIDVVSVVQRLTNVSHIFDENYVKVVLDKNMNTLYFSRLPIPFSRKLTPQTTDVTTPEFPPYYLHLGLYAFTRKALLAFASTPPSPMELSERQECIRYLEMGMTVRMVEAKAHKGVAIDVPEDLENAERLWVELGKPM
ncbi:MAG: 3-deoxy-manno-octulosonate cytidylyltransferase [Bacteroidales bacterium]|jgi:3-deoxy-D-manno-octulosonate cytidylyltransferase|nr:3-deoxy-manno-octulosonate cytidylyltransferase [Bacteroidales bacterium]